MRKKNSESRLCRTQLICIRYLKHKSLTAPTVENVKRKIGIFMD